MARQVLAMPRGPMLDQSGRLTREWEATTLRVHAATGFVETLIAVVSLADVPTNLTDADANQLVSLGGAYNHLLLWNGELWKFAPGDVGNSFLRTFPAGVVPQEAGWVLCNGQATDYLVVGASLLRVQAFTTTVIANTYFRR